ncbi:mannanase [Crucibulum laeve]|uniref:mannan endo-1,4-beta-mannosidase n=1 Tax=Crucibulum laeve TaxID=68775 RepID=A0A5C3MHX6_9AGAR|nr:mannanase [Crucibulum laeve]
MMKLVPSLVALTLAITPTLAAVPAWGQCGGINHKGETTCVSDHTCTYLNVWYSQCIPRVATSTTSTFTSTRSSTTVSSTASSTSSTSAPPAATGFVKTSGTQFTLNGSKYTVVGTNSYWIGLSGLSETDMNQAFADMAKGGATTVRTWGFNDVKSANGIYYQLWSGSSATVNTGSTGVQNFDKVVAAAKANGIRLIVALSDYGGMDVYVSQIVGSGQPHDLFYTNADIKNAFKNYIKTFVGRYANEPTILGWELANKPRCKGSSSTASSSCTPATVTVWAKEISAYIKSIDSNHLVAIGDEGFYNTPGAPTYPYQGGEGIDFDVNLAISTLDFGTFHSSNIQNWGTQWIADHATSQNRVGKPVIIEEYGVTTNKPTVYDAWLSQVFSSGWQVRCTGAQAGSRLPGGSTHDDGYTIYPDSPAFSTVQSHAAALKERA